MTDNTKLIQAIETATKALDAALTELKAQQTNDIRNEPVSRALLDNFMDQIERRFMRLERHAIEMTPTNLANSRLVGIHFNTNPKMD